MLGILAEGVTFVIAVCSSSSLAHLIVHTLAAWLGLFGWTSRALTCGALAAGVGALTGCALAAGVGASLG